jgi:hypothetical protein
MFGLIYRFIDYFQILVFSDFIFGLALTLV